MTTNKDLRILIESLIHKLDQLERKLMKTLQEVIDDVESESTVIDGLSTLVDGISQQLKDTLSGEKLSPQAQAKVDAIFDKVEANKVKLTEAITKNTPAENTGG